MRLRRNRKRTTTHPNTARNTKIRQTNNHSRWHRYQNRGSPKHGPETQEFLRMRRNSQKRSNHAPRRPQRSSPRISRATRIPARKHPTTIGSYHNRTKAQNMTILGTIREVLKTAKHRRPSRIYCPRCASPKIHLSSSLDMWLTPRKYVCDDCGYNGSIVMELEKEETTK